MKQVLVAICFYVVACKAVFADHGFDTESSYSSSSFGQNLSYNGREKSWLWNLGFDFQRAKARDSSTGAEFLDHTYDFSAGYGYSDIYGVNLGAHFSATPKEKLNDFGLSLASSLKWNLTTPANEEDFSPSMKTEGVFTFDYYKQTFSHTATVQKRRRTGAVTRTTDNTIAQPTLGLNQTCYLQEWLTLGLNYQYAFYSKDVTDFLNSLDNAQVVSRLSQGLSTTLSGFTDHAIQPKISVYPFETLELYSKFYYSRNASGGQWLKALKSGVYYDFLNYFSVGAAYRRDFDVLTSANTYYANLGASF